MAEGIHAMESDVHLTTAEDGNGVAAQAAATIL